MFIFLDESGDLGFDFVNKRPSEKFVITLLVCDSRNAVDSFRIAVKRTLKNKLNHKKSNPRFVEELHATHLSLSIKQYFYRQVKNRDWHLYAVALNKRRVYGSLITPAGRKKLYNFLSHFLIEKIDLSNANPSVTMVIDKCKNKEEIDDFNQYLANQIEGRLPLNIPLKLSHEDSKGNSGLQAVDLFCWGVFRKYERGDVEWYANYADKIAFETEYLVES